MKELLAGAAALALATAAASPAAAADFKPEDLIDVRKKTLKILNNNDLDTAIEKLGNPENGALDLEGPGLHTWAFKGKGIVLWDHSGQSEEGMDLSNLTGMNGVDIIGSVKKGVRNGKDLIKWEDELPHPTTDNVTTSYVSCDTFASEKYVCAMAWF